MKRSFTLIELLIVIGILSVLVVTILITLNPSEAQKKTRDTKRMKDMATLQSIIEQYIADGNAPICTGTVPPNPTAGCDSKTAGQVQSQPCATSWLGVDVCKYTNTVPVDPRNGVVSNVVDSDSASQEFLITYGLRYQMKMVGSDYEINVFQESKSNVNNVKNDGGTSSRFVETGSSLTIM